MDELGALNIAFYMASAMAGHITLVSQSKDRKTPPVQLRDAKQEL